MFTNGDFHVSVDRWCRYDEADDETLRRWNNEMRMGVRRYGILFWVFRKGGDIVCEFLQIREGMRDSYLIQ